MLELKRKRKPAPVLEDVKKALLGLGEDLELKETCGATFGSEGARNEILRVLRRAAHDPGFIAQLTYRGSEALESYSLTAQEKAALLSGDIRWLEAHVGKLDEQLKTWLWCRLGQEIW